MYLYLISKCQCHTARFVVGQNLYIYKQSRKSATTNWTRSITDWYDEVELFGKERVKPFKFSTDVGNHLKTKICIVHLWCFKSRICKYFFFIPHQLVTKYDFCCCHYSKSEEPKLSLPFSNCGTQQKSRQRNLFLFLVTSWCNERCNISKQNICACNAFMKMVQINKNYSLFTRMTDLKLHTYVMYNLLRKAKFS